MTCDLCSSPARYHVTHVVDDGIGGTGKVFNDWCEACFELEQLSEDFAILDVVDLLVPPPPPVMEQKGSVQFRIIDSSLAYSRVIFPKRFSTLPHVTATSPQMRTHVCDITPGSCEVQLSSDAPLTALVSIEWHATIE